MEQFEKKIYDLYLSLHPAFILSCIKPLHREGISRGQGVYFLGRAYFSRKDLPRQIRLWLGWVKEVRWEKSMMGEGIRQREIRWGLRRVREIGWGFGGREIRWGRLVS